MMRFASLVSTLLLAGCALAQSSSDPNAKLLLWLDHADVKPDFRRHVVQQHDTRFIGVYGYAATIPGLDEALKPRLMQQHRVRFIEGTSDAITSPDYGRSLVKAYHYAEQYNTLLLHYLRDHPNT